MPYKPSDPTFYDESGFPFTYVTTSINEPISPATTVNGTSFGMTDTPLSDSETYRAVRNAGPAAAKIQLALDGGSFADAASGIAVGGTPGVERSLAMRVVGLPYAGSGLNPSVMFAVVVTDSGEAGWMG